ncbi:MAG: hypothetical protein K9L30_12940 [Desulfobacterales bacterium]|nr:hypothetical protein [Desulfobacterales bacterium]
MTAFEEAVNSDNQKTIRKLFPDEADQLLADGKYKTIRQCYEALPEKERQADALLSFYYCLSAHLIDPYGIRKILFELIPLFSEQKSYHRVAVIYSTLLINYMYYEERDDKVLRLVQEIQSFVEKYEIDLEAHTFKILNTWIQLGRWWVFLEYDHAFEIALHAEEIALELKDEAALIFSRIALGRLYRERGKFKQSLDQHEKAMRVADKNPANSIYLPFIHYLQADTYLGMRATAETKQETEKGFATLEKGSPFCYHLYLLEMFNFFNIGQFDQCESIIEKVLSEYPDPNSDYRKYVMLFGQLNSSFLSGDKVKTEYYCNRLSQKESTRFFLYDYPLTYLHFAEANLFINNVEVVLTTLDNLIKEAPESRFPYAVSTSYALMGMAYSGTGDNAAAANCFKHMDRILIEYDIEEMEVLNISLLEKIAQKSHSKIVHNFVNHYQSRQQNPVVRPRPWDNNSETATAPEARSGHAIEILTLGSLKVFINGKQIPGIKLERQKKLFHLFKLMIIYRDKGLPKEMAYNTFWEGYSPRSARDNLNMLVLRLRRLLGADINFISSETEYIRLIKGAYRLDVDEFEYCFNEGKHFYRKGAFSDAIKLFEEAAGIYKGDFLGIDLYDDNIIEERENLKRKLIQALFKMTRIHLNDGDYQKAYQCADKLLVSDPYCEPGYRLLLISAVLSGNRAELPRIYKKLCEQLQHGLAVEPEIRTKELIEKLIPGTMPSRRMWDSERLL